MLQPAKPKTMRVYFNWQKLRKRVRQLIKSQEYKKLGEIYQLVRHISKTLGYNMTIFNKKQKSISNKTTSRDTISVINDDNISNEISQHQNSNIFSNQDQDNLDTARQNQSQMLFSDPKEELIKKDSKTTGQILNIKEVGALSLKQEDTIDSLLISPKTIRVQSPRNDTIHNTSNNNISIIHNSPQLNLLEPSSPMSTLSTRHRKHSNMSKSRQYFNTEQLIQSPQEVNTIEDFGKVDSFTFDINISKNNLEQQENQLHIEEEIQQPIPGKKSRFAKRKKQQQQERQDSEEK